MKQTSALAVEPCTPVTLTPRNCARCGGQFHSSNKQYICFRCHHLAPPWPRTQRTALSFREWQIVNLVRQAKANKEIAFDLCLTTGTVKEYLHHIFRKVGVKNRTELALWAADAQYTTS